LARVAAGGLELVDRRAEPHGRGDWRGARLELVRQVAPGRLLVPDRVDHVTAEQEGLHLLQQLGAAPERADAARSAHLVAGDREEVAVERLHVDSQVRRRLRRVADEDRALLVRQRVSGARSEIVPSEFETRLVATTLTLESRAIRSRLQMSDSPFS